MLKIKETDKAWIDNIWNKIDDKLSNVAPQNRGKIPYISFNGKYGDMVDNDIAWWTNGFWPGIMWLMYVGTGNEMYRGIAEESEELLDKAFENYERLNHDVGFMWLLSSGVNYRLFGGKKSKTRTALAADILASRYNASGKFIRAWDGDIPGRVIIDCMMNIPILYWASDEYNDPRFKYIAINHADTVMHTHVRPDGSCNHIVDLDAITGEPLECVGGQGYGVGSSWSRGQAWALYGYVLGYIHTKKDEYLDTAKRVAHYFISCVCSDWLPLCDFRAPEEPVIYDSTAGACAACGMIEIAKCVPECESRLYLNAAINILRAMEKHFCNWDYDEQAILGMGSEAYDRPKTMHVPIIYGDYFFVEAFYKLKDLGMLFW